MSSERISQLKQEIAELEAKDKAQRHKKNAASIAAIVDGMSYEEMCEVREVLNERIRSKYASDAIDDE